MSFIGDYLTSPEALGLKRLPARAKFARKRGATALDLDG